MVHIVKYSFDSKQGLADAEGLGPDENSAEMSINTGNSRLYPSG